MKVQLRILLFFLFIVLKTEAQELVVSANKTTLLIGEPVALKYTVTLPESGYTIKWAIPDSFPNFEIVHVKTSDSLINGNGTIETKIVSLTGFDSGKWPVQQVSALVEKDEKSKKLIAQPILLDIGYMPIDQPDIPRESKTILGVNDEENKWAFWKIIGLIILSLFGLILLIRTILRKKSRENGHKIFEKSAYERAIDSIQKLKNYPRNTTRDKKLFYENLVDIFRNYADKTLESNFLSSTTSEILIELKRKQINAEEVLVIAELLREADGVQFACVEPEPEIAVNRLLQLATFIKQLETQIVAKQKLS